MSELIDNSRERKNLLKHIILQLHEGVAPDAVKERLVSLLQKVPYGDVVEVEQELINEGLPIEEVLKLCDIHTLVLEGNIDQTGSATIPDGHPIDVMKKENIELKLIAQKIIDDLDKAINHFDEQNLPNILLNIKHQFNLLMDVEKHYLKKENLIFPYMEKIGITGPPKVMWGKHDETRALLKSALSTFSSQVVYNKDEFEILSISILKVAAQSILDMIYKEEEILFPMIMDRITTIEWYDIYKQIPEIGFCLYDPPTIWRPEGMESDTLLPITEGEVNLSTGSLAQDELISILNTLPVDITFIDNDDKVKFFSHGAGRIFQRNRAILKRDVRMCHPPSSVDVVEKILNDFKVGKESRASFWINFQSKFVYIEYFAVRNDKGNYLGTLEVTQDLTEVRKLEGEQRLLSYSKGK